MSNWRNESDREYCLDAAKERVVPCESAEAAYHLVSPGGSLPLADAERYGLTGQAEPEPEPEEKAERPKANKARMAAPEDKGARIARR